MSSVGSNKHCDNEKKSNKVIVSRKIDNRGYFNKLASVQSHYLDTNIPPGMSKAEAAEQKKLMPSAAMISA
jgi:hypothetical protein